MQSMALGDFVSYVQFFIWLYSIKIDSLKNVDAKTQLQKTTVI